MKLLLAMQEGNGPSEWPYEGVYRVGGAIPVGYRVGGTAIVSLALLAAPGYAEDEARRAALGRALGFVLEAQDHPLMSPEYEGGYDVRGWGHCYALALLARLQQQGRIPQGLEKRVEQAAARAVGALHTLEIPREGGWAYARERGQDRPSPPSPFMTAPCLLALFEARRAGHAVDEGCVERGLATLERARLESGSVAYAVRRGPQRDGVPGAVGRMLATEATLALAGRAPIERVRGALDAFLAHWGWLEARRARPGTHEPPYGVAPYYFFYAHAFAALAIELLPQHERAEYRRRLRELLFAVRSQEGSWNDRVFPRSAAYGTAMVLLSLCMPGSEPPARWEKAAPADSR